MLGFVTECGGSFVISRLMDVELENAAFVIAVN
jgi:hypothetical protein